MPDPADDDDLENVTDKKVEGKNPGDSTMGSKARPRDNLDQIPPKPTFVLHIVHIQDHLLDNGAGPEDIIQPPTQKTPQGP